MSAITKGTNDLLKYRRAIRNGVSPWALITSLVMHRAMHANHVWFKGVYVRAPDRPAMWAVAAEILMLGGYDIPGFVPGPGWKVVDIGGNVGVYSMLAASRGAHVTAYEPHPEVFAAMKANTAKWNVDCRQAAVVGAPRASVTLYINPDRDTRNSLLAEPLHVGGTRLAQGLDVPAVALAEVLADTVDLLKIDCEGGEFEIFANGGDSLHNAKRIVAEVHRGLGDPQEVLAQVRAAGFHAQLHEAVAGEEFQLLTAIRA